jgi:hypothetical protein
MWEKMERNIEREFMPLFLDWLTVGAALGEPGG